MSEVHFFKFSGALAQEAITEAWESMHTFFNKGFNLAKKYGAISTLFDHRGNDDITGFVFDKEVVTDTFGVTRSGVKYRRSNHKNDLMEIKPGKEVYEYLYTPKASPDDAMLIEDIKTINDSKVNFVDIILTKLGLNKDIRIKTLKRECVLLTTSLDLTNPEVFAFNKDENTLQKLSEEEFRALGGFMN